MDTSKSLSAADKADIVDDSVVTNLSAVTPASAPQKPRRGPHCVIELMAVDLKADPLASKKSLKGLKDRWGSPGSVIKHQNDLQRFEACVAKQCIRCTH
jgi:hypothetical protein